MASTTYTSNLRTFTLDDLVGTYEGDTFATTPALLDTAGNVVEPFTDRAGDILYGVDSEFGFDVTDFIGAEDKTLNEDYGEGFAGNIGVDLDGNGFIDADEAIGLAVRNAPTDLFRTPPTLGTWLQGLGGTTVKASTEHYGTMVQVLSDQAFPNDPGAVYAVDNDLRIRDLAENGLGGFTEGLLHDFYVSELVTALERSIDNNEASTNPQTYNDLDFDRDGLIDAFDTLTVVQNIDTDGDGVTEAVDVAALDINQDGTADLFDGTLNGLGNADVTDLIAPNESTVLSDIAYTDDYSITVKDDGKLLYRFGTVVKRPNDIRLDVKLELPEEWTADEDDNGIADLFDNGAPWYNVTRAELIVTHNITNNPNDQIRPEDYENEAAIGRLPAHYIVQDPDDPTNTLWVSPVDSFDGTGAELPSYFILDEDGNIDPFAGTQDSTAVFTTGGAFVGWRAEDSEGNATGTVLRDLSMENQADTYDLNFTSSDLSKGYTVAWYTTIDREPFEWSYDKFPDDPDKNVYESFRSPEEAAEAGYSEDDLVSGPRWRLTPNKFGQDLPGLEVPAEPLTSPPYQRDNIKYETGELTTTTINLLDWADENSPFNTAEGWMTVNKGEVDSNADGIIDEGWSNVRTVSGSTLTAGDALPSDMIIEAVTPNGQSLTANFLDTAVYVKGDRQDAAKLFDIQLVLEYDSYEAFVEVNGVSLPIDTYSGAQDQGVVTNIDAATVELTDNAWKKIIGDTPFEVSRGTVLSFDFSSDVEGEVHAIGFDTDDDHSNSRDWLFQLDGTQATLFNQVLNGDYTTGSGPQTYEITVGKELTGSFENIALVMDDDAGLGANSIFANIEVRTPEIEVNGEALAVVDYNGSQDKGIAKTPTSDTLELTRNAWKKIVNEDSFVITEDTVLSFDFSSDVEGEVHAIGFDNDGDHSNSRDWIFQLDGTQATAFEQAENGLYTTGSGAQTYQIAVGDHFTGSFDEMVFIMDDDSAVGADSVFSNITLIDTADVLIA